MHQSAQNGKASPFLTSTAVEAWDTWFRWRENGELRDDTIEATWQRVAAALAGVESPSERGDFERRLLDAFSDWRLLPDERVLAAAGSGTVRWPDDGLVAVLNLARFVRVRGSAPATVDLAALQDCARLAVRALDNAIVLCGGSVRNSKNTLRIGVIGLADALASLGLDYAGAKARAWAATVAKTLAEGCLRETIALAAARGAAAPCNTACIEKLRMRSMPDDLIDLARRHGLRHPGLTSITTQPKLAKFANDASDAIHPLAAHDGLAPSLLRSARPYTPSAGSVPAQLEIRGAMQPWIDEPIACPVLTDAKPTPTRHLDWYARAMALGLGALSWQL
jgi:ribonucleoside-diphosphate reductase alpha chain